MAHVKKADLRNLDEFADYLQNACAKNGIAPLTPFNSRKFASAPDKTEWAARNGIDILKLESRGIYSPDSDNSTYSRLLEEQLNRQFWPSNNTAQLGLPSMEPLPEMGTSEQPLPVGELPSSLSRYLQQTPPTSFRSLAALLLGCVARAKSRDPTKRPKDSFEPSSRKTKTGRRDYAKVPTFEQWCQKAGIKLTWLSTNAVQEATKVFNRILEDTLVVNFWPRHRTDDRRRTTNTVPILERQPERVPEGQPPVQDRVVRPGSVTLDARRDVRGGGRETFADLQGAKPDLARQTGDLGKITLWLESSFIDYDPAIMKTFLNRFPRITMETVLDVARNMWRQADGIQADEKYVNFQKFLHRLSAVEVLKIVRPKWTSEELQNFVYFELNHIYATVTAGCQMVCNKPMDPYDLVSKIPAMPILLEMNDAQLSAAVQRVVGLASKVGQTVSTHQYVEALAAAVRQAGASREQQDNVMALAKEIAATDLAQPPGAPFAAPPPLGVGGDTLHTLQHTNFGLKSTHDMVKTAIRKGLDPPHVEGPKWVLPSGVGGGAIDGRRRDEALLRAQVEEAIREIRADYGVDAAKAKYVQQQINEEKNKNRAPTYRTDNTLTGDNGKYKNLIANLKRRETLALKKAAGQGLV